MGQKAIKESKQQPASCRQSPLSTGEPRISDDLHGPPQGLSHSPRGSPVSASCTTIRCRTVPRFRIPSSQAEPGFRIPSEKSSTSQHCWCAAQARNQAAASVFATAETGATAGRAGTTATAARPITNWRRSGSITRTPFRRIFAEPCAESKQSREAGAGKPL
jgi:hypothetical protein